MKKINVKQVWEYEFKPTDTLRTLQAIAKACEQSGDRVELQRKGGKLYAVRINEDN